MSPAPEKRFRSERGIEKANYNMKDYYQGLDLDES